MLSASPVRTLSATLAVAVLLTGCTEPDRVNGGSMYNWYEIEEDVEIGSEVMARALYAGRQHPDVIIDEAPFHARVQAIVDRLAAVSHYPELPWEVHTMNANVPNAWCAPGGKIMVYAGLFLESSQKGFVRYQSDDELAAVLAHEISHATCRHVTNSMSWRYTAFFTFLPFYLAAIIIIPQLSIVWDLTFQGGFAVWSASYSRGDEEEADLVGAEYAARAGYDPRASLKVWQRAHLKFGSDSSILGSHPPNDDRVEELEEAMPRLVRIYERVKAGEQPPPYEWEEEDDDDDDDDGPEDEP